MFIEASLLDTYFYVGIFILIGVSFIAGYVDAVAGGAGLVLVPAFMMVGMPPQLALGQEKLVSTVGTIAAIQNFMRAKSIVWKIVPIGIIAALIGAYIGARVILLFDAHIIEYIIFALLPIGLVVTLFKNKIFKNKAHLPIKESAFFSLYHLYYCRFL